MRLLTALRRLENQKKDLFILVTTCLLTACIVIFGFFYTKPSFFYSQEEGAENTQATSTFTSFLSDAKATMSPAFSNIKKGVSSVSEGYKSSSFKDFFVPKKDQN